MVTDDEFFVDYPGDGARVRVMMEDDIDILRLDEERNIRVGNSHYRLQFATFRGAPTQLFTYTPLKKSFLACLEMTSEIILRFEVSGRPARQSKSLPDAARQGLSAIELKNEDGKASGEIRFLIDRLSEVGMISTRFLIAV